ncbi:GPW/gp25 family protein [Pasteurella multocida]
MQGIDDIHLCIANILNTIRGTDILRPEFGSDHFRYIDQPEDIAVPHFVREITFALSLWEKRINVDEIKVSGNAPHFSFTIFWSLKEDIYHEIYSTEVKG